MRIDDNFRADLRYRCTFESAETVCRGLANVYYTFVRAFGGDDATPGKREIDLVAEYENAVKEYDALVAEAQAAGRLPVPE